MAETIRYTLQKPARLLYASIVEKSAPRLAGGQTAEAKFSATFGVEEVDFKAMVDIMVRAITGEVGSFTKPSDYFLSCQGGKTAGNRAIMKAELDAHGKSQDEAFKIKEKAEARAKLYEPFAGILTASSKFDIELGRLEGGKIIDISEEAHARAQAGKDYFYPGAFVVPAVAFKAFRRKTIEAKDGCTAYLQNVLYVRKGEKLGGSGPSNSQVFGGFAQNYSDVDPLANAPSNSDLGGDDVEF